MSSVIFARRRLRGSRVITTRKETVMKISNFPYLPVCSCNVSAIKKDVKANTLVTTATRRKYKMLLDKKDLIFMKRYLNIAYVVINIDTTIDPFKNGYK